jgi:hypothetical protein
MVRGRQGHMKNMDTKNQTILMQQYSEARKILSTGLKKTEITKKKISESNMGKKISEETKKKLSIAMTGRYVGKKMPKEFGMKISKALKGHKKTKEHSDKINKNPEKIRKTAEKHRGMKRSEETKTKMKQSALLRMQREGGAWNKGMKMVDGKYTRVTVGNHSTE